MSENVVYMRGDFPFGIEMGIPPAMLQDARVVLELAPAQVSAIVDSLSAFAGFLDSANIEKIIRPYASQEEDVARFVRFFMAVTRRLAKPKQNADTILREVEESLNEQEESERSLTPQEVTKLRERLPLFVKSYPGLAKQAKATRLAKVTGNRLESVELICDVRPVFNEERTVIEGMILLTILRVVSQGADGLPVACEATLSEQQVKELASKANAAEAKLSQLKRTLDESGFVIPSTALTKEV